MLWLFSYEIYILRLLSQLRLVIMLAYTFHKLYRIQINAEKSLSQPRRKWQFLKIYQVILERLIKLVKWFEHPDEYVK